MKYFQIAFLVLGFMVLASSVKADETSRSTSTEVNAPGYKANSNTTTNTTTEDPAVVKQESTVSESSPGQESSVTTSKKYYVPKRQKTVSKHTETQVSQ
jgi:hypothetical protein